MKSWCPFATRVPASAAGSSWDTSYPWRGVLHTTESSTYTPSSDNYFGHSNYPHFTVDGGKAFQHYPLTVAARALANPAGGVETNRARAVQIEVVAKAAQPDWDDATVETVRQVIQWVNEQTGIEPDHPRFVGYPASYGVTASQRLTAEQWRRFNGWCGHQHVPENSHGDPGAIPIGALLEGDDMPLTDKDYKRIAEEVWRYRIRDQDKPGPHTAGGLLAWGWDHSKKARQFARAIARKVNA